MCKSVCMVWLLVCVCVCFESACMSCNRCDDHGRSTACAYARARSLHTYIPLPDYLYACLLASKTVRPSSQTGRSPPPPLSSPAPLRRPQPYLPVYMGPRKPVSVCMAYSVPKGDGGKKKFDPFLSSLSHNLPPSFPPSLAPLCPCFFLYRVSAEPCCMCFLGGREMMSIRRFVCLIFPGSRFGSRSPIPGHPICLPCISRSRTGWVIVGPPASITIPTLLPLSI